MKLDPIGKVDNPSDADLEPITIPICGLHAKKHENVCEEFDFRPTLPWGNTFALIESIENGQRNLAGNTVKWLRNCLVSDEERERFQGFLLSPDVEIEQSTIEGVYEALAETYSARPTLPRSASTGGGAKTKRTSQAVARSQASRSRKSQQR
jgi:hypothetical protein